MKKIIALLLCLCMLSSFTACRKDNGDNTSVIYEYEYVNGDSVSSADGSGTEETVSGAENANATASGNKNNDKNSSSQGGASNKDSGSQGGESNKNSGSQGDASNKDSDKAEIKNNCYSSGEKIAKDKVTLKVLVRDYSGGITNYNNCALTKYIEDKMNVKLQFTTCSQNEVSTKITLAYASGTNPYDIYMGMAPAGSLHNSYIKQGKLTKLDTLIKEYGPNIQKVFSSYPESQYLCTADDGNIYMLPMVNDAQNYCDLIYINKSWLTAVGKSVPTTTDDFKAVLDAFKSKYAGKTPFVVTSDAGEDVGPSAFGPFGISTYHNWMYIDQATDEIKYTCTSDAYRNGLRYYNSLYGAGLMKFAVNEDAVRKMTDADTVGAVLCNDYSKAFDANTFNSNWTMVPVLNTQSGGTWANVKYENIWPEWFLITDACKYPEIAVRLADWFYSEEGTLSSQYGPKGKYWSYNSDGSVKLDNSKVPSGKSTSEYLYSLTPSYCLPRFMGESYYALKREEVSTTAAAKMSQTINQLKDAMIKPNAQQKYYYPHLSYTEADAKNLKDLDDYGNYAYQLRKNFITGTKSIDSDWDSYVSTMNSTYKMNTVVQVNNTVYKRYKAWLATKK